MEIKNRTYDDQYCFDHVFVCVGKCMNDCGNDNNKSNPSADTFCLYLKFEEKKMFV